MKKKNRCCVFGEILWDVFGEEKHIGGASLNFAAHFNRLGGEAFMISALGEDELGKEAQKSLEELGLTQKYVAITDKPTGYCQVTLDKTGTPSYELVRNVAYDFIPYPENWEKVKGVDALYFGTLAQRMETSRETVDRFLKSGKFRHIIFDINIRQNHYTPEIIDKSLSYATILKISRDEADVLEKVGITGSLEEKCRGLSVKYPNLKIILMTLDAEGSFAYDCKTGAIEHSPVPGGKVVSTVGAGDSFSACFLYCYMSGMPVRECISRATRLSDFVVTKVGAVPDYDREMILG